MIIFLPIENKTREFYPKLYLANKILKNSKHQVILGGQRYINYKIKDFENCLWFDKHTFYERLKKRGIHLKNKIVVLDEEGPISIHDNYTKYLYQKEFTNLINHILLWGAKDKFFLNKSDHKKISITGHPKYDLVKKSKNLFKKEIHNIKKKYKKFVFIPGHFSLIDHTKTIKVFNNALLKKYKNRKKIINKIILDNDLEAKNYIEFLKLIIELAKKNPSITFVFRRHPLEDQNLINEFFKQKPKNLKLAYKYVVTPWVSACEYFLHSGCTSVFEAVAAEKKIILYNSKKISKLNRFRSLKISNWNFDDQNKIINFFKKLTMNKRNYKLIKNVGSTIKNINKNKDFQSEFLSLIKKIKFKSKSKIIFKNKETSAMKKKIYSLKTIIRKILSVVKNRIILRSILIQLIPEKHIYGQKMGLLKFDSIKKKEIIDFLSKVEEKKINDIVVSKISESVFHLYKK